MATNQTQETTDSQTLTWQVPLTFGKLMFATVYRITRPRAVIGVTILIAVINALVAISDYQTFGDWSPLAYILTVIFSVIGGYAIGIAGLAVRALKVAKVFKGQPQNYTVTPQNLTIKAGGLSSGFDRPVITKVTAKRWGYALSLKTGSSIVLFVPSDRRKKIAGELTNLNWL